ncbi:MAG: HEPN domain-containing protein [Planctomycetota bacterium]
MLGFEPAEFKELTARAMWTGDWVEDVYTEGHITYEYKSDYDILVVTEFKKNANNQKLQRKLEDRLSSAGTPVSVIYHHITQVNTNLASGWYFFSDIKKEGILLYDSKRFTLARRKKLDPAERKRIAEQDFKQWFSSAKKFYATFQTNFEKTWYKNAAFQLHQATERVYIAVLLVFTGYRPNTHDIEKMGRKAAGFNPEFLKVFPRATAEQEGAFKLLKKAYVDARYKASYRITKKQLEYLGKRVKLLQRLTKTICRKKIESFA